MLGLIALAVGGQVFNQEVPLEQVVSRAQVAVRLEVGSPAMTPVAIPIPGKGARDCGTYDYGAWVGTIREVIHAPDGLGLAVGQRLVVLPGNTSSLIALSTSACVDGISRSPAFLRYAGSPPADGETAVALIRWEPGFGWVEAIAGAWLDRGDERRLAKLTWSTTEPPVDRRDALCVASADCPSGACVAMRCAQPPPKESKRP